MPRQISVPAGATFFKVATLESSSVRIMGAQVTIEGLDVQVYAQTGKLLREFTLDSVASNNADLFTGLADGQPFTIRKLDRCPCKGTQVVPK